MLCLKIANFILVLKARIKLNSLRGLQLPLSEHMLFLREVPSPDKRSTFQARHELWMIRRLWRSCYQHFLGKADVEEVPLRSMKILKTSRKILARSENTEKLSPLFP